MNSLVERVLRRVEMPHGPIGCWLWQGGKSRGYGQLSVGDGSRSRAYTHRVIYEAFVGRIPAGYQIDHLCRVPACCNPWHLEPVTPRVNTMRGETPAAKNAAKTHCIRGHVFDAENTQRDRKGGRACRICRNAAALASYHRTKRRPS